MSTGRQNLLPIVQGLRAVAVLAVVLFHAWPSALPGGFVGVDVFFVISGYLITGLLVRELDRTGRIDFAAFYARRVRRLVPAAALVIVCTLLFALLVYAPLEVKTLTSTVIASLAYVSNIWFAHQAVDYLAHDASRDPLLHTWSLSVEEQFYLVWPVLLLGVAVVFRERMPNHRLAGWTIAALSVLSFGACIFLTSTWQPLAFFGAPTRAWEFGVGGLVALWIGRKTGTGLGLLRWAGLAAIIGSSLLYSGETSFPGYAAVVPVAGTAMILAAATRPAEDWPSRLLSSSALGWIGDRSYSLYLWHWPVLILLQDWARWPAWLESAAAVFAAVFLAALTYRFLENPIRFASPARLTVGRTLAFGAMATLASIAIAVSFRSGASSSLNSDEQTQIQNAVRDQPKVYALNCHQGVLSVQLKNCSFGAENSRHTIVLLGDSKAAQWFPALERLANRYGWTLHSWTKSGCPAAIHEPHSPQLHRAYTECSEWRSAVLERIAELGPDLVIVSSSSRYALPENLAEGGVNEAWLAANNALLGKLSSIARRVVLVHDTPWAYSSIPNCLSRARWRGLDAIASCSFDAVQGSSRDRMLAERQAADKFENVDAVDMTTIVCPNGRCSPLRDAMILFSDEHHLTATYSSYLANDFSRHIPKWLLDERAAGVRITATFLGAKVK